MINFVRTVSLLLSAVLALSCSREFQALSPSNPDFRYPLTPGTEWRYDRQIVLADNSSSLQPDVSTSIVTVQIISVDSIFDAQATKVREHIISKGASLINYHYYENSAEGLYLLGSIGENAVLPKRSIAAVAPDRFIQSTLWGDSFAFSAGDSIYQELPPKLALKYPLSPGSQWKFRDKGQPRRIEKRIIAELKVETPAGNFEVVQIQWLLDFDNDGEFDDNIEFFDYISNIGLVKRSFLIRGLPLIDDNGYNIGSYNYLDESVLSAHRK